MGRPAARPRVDWYYHRPGCSTCIRADVFLEEGRIEVVERVPASRRLQASDALRIIGQSARLWTAKGRAVNRFVLADGQPPAAILPHMLGPTGNLRAPLLRIGDLCLVGFNADLFAEAFS